VAGSTALSKKLKFWISVFSLLSANYSYSQVGTEAVISHSTSKPFVFSNERLKFNIDINNPTETDLNLVRLDIQFSGLVEVRGLDDDCSMWLPGGLTALVCIIPEVKANTEHKLEYDIVGDIDLRPGFSSTITATSTEGSISIDEQAQGNSGLVDGDRSIEGATLDLVVVRDILFDVDQDGVSDVNEIAMGTNPFDINSVTEQTAVIDVAVLYSTLANTYYSGEIESRINRLVTATNQLYRDSEVGITLRVVAMEEVTYAENESALEQTLSNFTTQTHAAFTDLATLRTDSGADLLLFAHALDRVEGEISCGVGSLIGESLQGDFDRDTFEGTLLSVIDVGRACLGQMDLAEALSPNMGITPSRQENPEGGTFSFSTGYAVEDVFSTRVANISNLSAPVFGDAVRINRFSTPSALCLGHPCGIDRNNVASGADAVFSLNATRFVVSDLTPEVFPVLASDLEQEVTVDSTTTAADFSLVQTSQHVGAFVNDWITFNVEAHNQSLGLFNDLEFRFSSLTASNLIRTSDPRCIVVGETISNISVSTETGVENRGELLCYVEGLGPLQSTSFSYSVQVEALETLEESDFFRQFGTVNNVAFSDAVVCLPVFPDLISATSGSDVCSRFVGLSDEAQEPDTTPDGVFDLNLRPSIDGAIITVPYIRLFDGSLLSAQFNVLVFEQISLELISFEFISSELLPQIPSYFTAEGELQIRELALESDLYNLTLDHVVDSNPATFSDLELLKIPNP
jgi:hypothetical protein